MNKEVKLWLKFNKKTKNLKTFTEEKPHKLFSIKLKIDNLKKKYHKSIKKELKIMKALLDKTWNPK